MSGIWQGLLHQPAFNTGTMILLTDGRVMVHEEGTAHWHALSPDSSGSYINGTWATLADMSFWRRYFASGVLKDGRVFVCGGEQTGDVGDTNKGEIYDPVSDTWSPIATPSWNQVGDAASCVLPDGRVMIGALLSGNCIIYDPTTNSWTTTGAQSGRTNEETWLMLGDNTVLTMQCFAPYRGVKYNIANGTWQDEGAIPVTIVDAGMSEVGPGMLMYNNRAIFFGAANSAGRGKTVLYTAPAVPTGVGTWTAGPDIPLVGGQVMVCNDCPATLLPNGNVLFTSANYVSGSWGSPIYFFEYDPIANTIVQAPTPPNNATFPYSSSPGVYWSRMMLLPTGQVLFSACSDNVQCYTPSGGPQNAWRPTINSVTNTGISLTGTYLLEGTQLNGLSQANTYGDDCYCATNYPLVRLTDTTTSEVFYCRTFAFSTMAVSTGSSIQSAQFSAAGVPFGLYQLAVVANGIASFSDSFQHKLYKPDFIDGRFKREFEFLGKIVYEGDPFNRRDWIVDPDYDRLQIQIKLLQNGMQRLTSLIHARELPHVGKGVAKEAKVADNRKRAVAKKAKKAKRR